MRPVLLALRFLLELLLLAAVVLAAVRAVGGVTGWLVGVLAAVVVAAVWGVLLSPRRRADLPLPVRVGVELVLFAGASLALAAAGLPLWGLALIVAEVAVLLGLFAVGLPPGTDVGATG